VEVKEKVEVNKALLQTGKRMQYQKICPIYLKYGAYREDWENSRKRMRPRLKREKKTGTLPEGAAGLGGLY